MRDGFWGVEATRGLTAPGGFPQESGWPATLLGLQEMMDKEWGKKRRAVWAAGIAVLVLAVPAMAQRETRLPFQQPPSGLEMASVTVSAQQPSGPGNQTTDDQGKRKDEQPGTSSNRLFGTLPDFLTVENVDRVPPLTTKQKFDATSRSTFDWGQYLFCAGLAGIGQAQNVDPSYGQGVVGYAKRFGLAFADVSTENVMTTAVVPSLLHQDPRYYRMGKGKVLHRMGYSVSRIVVTRSDTGHEQFNFSEIGGALAAAGLYNAFHPSSDRTVGNTLSSWIWQVGYDTLFIGVREFWPDLRRKFSRASRASK
jgi:hypothetical protein